MEFEKIRIEDLREALHEKTLKGNSKGVRRIRQTIKNAIEILEK